MLSGVMYADTDSNINKIRKGRVQSVPVRRSYRRNWQENIESQLISEEDDRAKQAAKARSKKWRRISAFFALDWILLKAIFSLANYLFSMQRSFLEAEIMISACDRGKESEGKARKVYCDAFEYDETGNLMSFRRRATHAQLRTLPFLDGFNEAENEVAIDERQEEKEEWNGVTFYLFSVRVRDSMNEGLLENDWLHFFCFTF